MAHDNENIGQNCISLRVLAYIRPYAVPIVCQKFRLLPPPQMQTSLYAAMNEAIFSQDPPPPLPEPRLPPPPVLVVISADAFFVPGPSSAGRPGGLPMGTPPQGGGQGQRRPLQGGAAARAAAAAFAQEGRVLQDAERPNRRQVNFSNK